MELEKVIMKDKEEEEVKVEEFDSVEVGNGNAELMIDLLNNSLEREWVDKIATGMKIYLMYVMSREEVLELCGFIIRLWDASKWTADETEEFQVRFIGQDQYIALVDMFETHAAYRFIFHNDKTQLTTPQITRPVASLLSPYKSMYTYGNYNKNTPTSPTDPVKTLVKDKKLSYAVRTNMLTYKESDAQLYQDLYKSDGFIQGPGYEDRKNENVANGMFFGCLVKKDPDNIGSWKLPSTFDGIKSIEFTDSGVHVLGGKITLLFDRDGLVWRKEFVINENNNTISFDRGLFPLHTFSNPRIKPLKTFNTQETSNGETKIIIVISGVRYNDDSLSSYQDKVYNADPFDYGFAPMATF
tara:strand:- start:49445 stop:50512 length:1068 start_codon:yes stop_codon:yes gene_type:complete